MPNLKFLVLALLFGCFGSLSAQDDLLAELEAESTPETEYTLATFKGTRIVNLQSPELPAEGVMQYMILHRFGSFSQDYLHNFFGLHNAQVRLTLDYGIKDWLNVGLGSSSFAKMYDGFVKVRLLRQSSGKVNMPFSLVAHSGVFYTAARTPPDRPLNTVNRFSYVHQLVLARKFTQDFSMSLNPTLVHYNTVDSASYSNDLFCLGLGARYKFTPMHALSVEYVYQVNPTAQFNEDGQNRNYRNALSIGFDIETGGHVFQLFLTNSRGVSEPLVFGQTPGSWAAGDIHFGFNISRVFTLRRPKQPD